MPDAAEHVAEEAKAPFPRHVGEDKLLVSGPDPEGELLQLIFVLDEEDGGVYILHARPLTNREKRRYRKRIR